MYVSQLKTPFCFALTCLSSFMVDGLIGEVLFWTFRKCLGDEIYHVFVHSAWVKIFSQMLKILIPLAISYELIHCNNNNNFFLSRGLDGYVKPGQQQLQLTKEEELALFRTIGQFQHFAQIVNLYVKPNTEEIIQETQFSIEKTLLAQQLILSQQQDKNKNNHILKPHASSQEGGESITRNNSWSHVCYPIPSQLQPHHHQQQHHIHFQENQNPGQGQPSLEKGNQQKLKTSKKVKKDNIRFSELF